MSNFTNICPHKKNTLKCTTYSPSRPQHLHRHLRNQTRKPVTAEPNPPPDLKKIFLLFKAPNPYPQPRLPPHSLAQPSSTPLRVAMPTSQPAHNPCRLGCATLRQTDRLRSPTVLLSRVGASHPRVPSSSTDGRPNGPIQEPRNSPRTLEDGTLARPVEAT